MTPETVKFEVSEWLLKHGFEAVKGLKERVNPNYKLLPDFAYEIFLESYENESMRILREGAMKALNVNYEQIELFFNKNYVIMLLGRSILEP